MFSYPVICYCTRTNDTTKGCGSCRGLVVLSFRSLLIFVYVLAPLFVIAATQIRPGFAPLQSLTTKAIFWVCGKKLMFS